MASLPSSARATAATTSILVGVVVVVVVVVAAPPPPPSAFLDATDVHCPLMLHVIPAWPMAAQNAAEAEEPLAGTHVVPSCASLAARAEPAVERRGPDGVSARTANAGCGQLRTRPVET